MSYLVCWSLDRLELVGDRGLGSVGVGYGKGIQKAEKWGQKRVRKLCFRGRQVGAFSVFWHGHTGGPFIFWAFWPFFRKMVRLRG